MIKKLKIKLSRPLAIAFAFAGIATLLLATGCGGGDDATAGDGTVTKPLTKAAFIKKADSLCAKTREVRFNEAVAYRKSHEKELEALKPVPAEEQIIRAITLPSVEKELEELKALGAPKGQEKKIDTIMSAIAKGIKGAEKNPYAVELEVPLENPFREADELLRAYGFEECRNIA
jgi:hypothetical protein